ncbi:MAG: hypothetical protein POELPBGB_02878 [Bacteroidia bacterium]|nr:hypothetical protein [Bacteroidia bacterium]
MLDFGTIIQYICLAFLQINEKQTLPHWALTHAQYR